jgi:cell division initiation protein
MDGFHTQEYESSVFEDEASYEMEEEDEPRRELRRTSRKLKKKAMF